MSIIPLDNIVSKHEAFTNASIHEFGISKMSGRSNIGLTDDSIIGAFLTSREKTKINKKNAARILSNCIDVDFIDKFETLFKENKLVKREIDSKGNTNLKFITISYDGSYLIFASESVIASAIGNSL